MWGFTWVSAYSGLDGIKTYKPCKEVLDPIVLCSGYTDIKLKSSYSPNHLAINLEDSTCR